MMLKEIVSFLDDYLKISEWEGIDSSKNGLQVECCEEVNKVAFSVDACMDVFKKAVEAKADLLVTHHGIIWGEFTVTGIYAKRLKFLFENGLSLYSAHLPLDAHLEVGNNVQILKKLDIEVEGSFAFYRGKAIGYYGNCEHTIEEIAEKLKRELETELRILKFKDRINKVGVVSGRGGFSIYEAGNLGIDLLITGEMEHSIYHVAKELGINVIFAGHYATETVGLKALMEKMSDVETVFIECPTNI